MLDKLTAIDNKGVCRHGGTRTNRCGTRSTFRGVGGGPRREVSVLMRDFSMLVIGADEVSWSR